MKESRFPAPTRDGIPGALQCFYQAGTYGNLTVTTTGTGCGTFGSNVITGVWLGNGNTTENCQFDISPAVVGSTVEVQMSAHSVTYPSWSEEAVFSLNGSFVAVSPGDIDNSIPAGGVDLLVGTGGAADPTVGGVSSAGPDGKGTVSFSAAPDAVSSINIQHNLVIGGPLGTIYQVCADDEGGVVEPIRSAIFEVTKNFADDNTQPVEVELLCNGGVPLRQTFELSDQQGQATPSTDVVRFVVTNFSDGATDCWVTETPVDGYEPTYLASGDSESDDSPESESCHFIDVSYEDENSCAITNGVDSVSYTVNKEWDWDSDVDGIPQFGTVEVFCENFRTTPDGSLGNDSFEFLVSDEDSSYDVDVYPNWKAPATRCCAVESQFVSYVESDGGCASWTTISVGDADRECTITNTVFYEGIPTLSQYGLAIMALLMLGIGFVGFRRFV